MSSALAGLSEEGLWQTVEFADYVADLPLWEELLSGTKGHVLDLGCGIGRVAHHLARHGAKVTGVDLDPGLVRDFNTLADELELPDGGSAVAIEGDAAQIAAADGPLTGHSFDLILAPQQFVQLLDGPARSALFDSARRLLAPGGLAAFAICEDLPDESIHFPGVLPDAREEDGWYYSSMPVAIEPSPGWITSLRRRDKVSPEGSTDSRNEEVRLYRLDRKALESELRSSGLQPVRAIEIPQTDRHMGSTAVVARPPDGALPVPPA